MYAGSVHSRSPMSCPRAPAGVKNAVPGCPAARLPGKQPVLVAAVHRLDHRDPVRRHRGAPAAAMVRVRGDDEQVTLGLETSMDRDLQIAIEVIKHVEAVLLDELAERCCGYAGSFQ